MHARLDVGGAHVPEDRFPQLSQVGFDLDVDRLTGSGEAEHLGAAVGRVTERAQDLSERFALA
ncbi:MULTISPECIES: hypothetical protein [Methylobacterium]|uniref:Uncharacterized protein n=1 Tax=Methylobacterium thuringiense TaxID=1003091 RepID=A0ABQ4TJY6_9HYPH|nr:MULTISPECIES: hypothetical protein [Methylobacterium]GJE55603.1 hypothetical protein EKPJFOCH_2098 [Methylobacterium thuringiense]